MLRISNICGVILAGGQSRRMGGGDKCLLKLGGKTLLRRSLDAVAPQVGPLLVNTNSEPGLFSDYKYPIVADVIDGFPGPLAGVLTAMEWALENAPDCSWVASFASDAPFLPNDLVENLMGQIVRDRADMACASSDGQVHPIFAMWPVCLAGALRTAVDQNGIRKVDSWTAHYNLTITDYDTTDGDPFFNINRPHDLAEAALFIDGRINVHPRP